jgi:hypothetical protein
MINGMNADLALVISCILGFRIDEEIPRFRDVFLKADDCPIDDYDFIIYTRMGGGNYECWEDNEENCDCPYHKLLKIEESPWYVAGYDDDFDCTYRSLVCKFTPEQKKIFNDVKENGFAVIEKQAKELFPSLFKVKESK